MSAWLTSVMAGVPAAVPVRFCEGDHVEILRASRLPVVEEVMGDGIVAKITGTADEPLYWVSGFLTARTARQLRLISRAR